MIKTIASKCVAVTTSDTNYITGHTGDKVIGSLYIGTTGDVVVLPWEHADTNSAVTTGVGGAMIFKNIPSGSFLPVAVRKVFSTGTTASDIICNYN